jgi:repressor LexA
MLTQKQQDLLIFIHERMAGGNIAPSFEEMKEHLGLKSKSGIHRLISALVERGYLVRLPHRARALEVKKLPEAYQPDEHDKTKAAAQIRNVNSIFDEPAPVHSNTEPIPLYGKIAAGTPIEAIAHEGDMVDIPIDMLTTGGAHYALTVDGDSMIKAGINDCDTIIVRRCDTAEDGTIVVALIDDEEVTLKRLRRKDGKIILEPENDDYEARSFDPHRVRIQGKLVSLYRTYH